MYKVLSVGGSIIIPKTGFDTGFLKQFRELILDRVKKGDKFVMVVGGGATCRQYNKAILEVTKLSSEQLDWLGIYATWFNAQFVRLMFGEYAYEEVINSPFKKISTKKPIIISQGYKPGWSSDYTAILLTKTYGAKTMVNLTNVDYVYDKDPNKFSDAKKIERISWKDFRKNIVGYKWVPGANVPFDPIASSMAEKNGLTVKIVNGKSLEEVKKVLCGGKFKGTVIED